MLKIASWNIRGLNNPLKQKEVYSFISSQKLQLMGILETKVRATNLCTTFGKCFPAHWSYSHNLGSSSVARIVVAWDPQCLVVDVLQTSDQMVCAKVQIVASSKILYLSIVYASNSFVERRRLWAEMRVFNSVCGNSPWIMVGDYNIVRARSERLEGFDSNAVGDFNNCLDDLEMEDLL
ncbi:hypothetical protein RHMOL_Rhmol06G0175000 [Rhododendron molle]|uniref:Uncharacterized protein n=1 Tax=Rhododendron molle TaxID=49168 RepID=A0ACC0NEH1_RHOML|nr:hypothetical protein RHMOL_Rhmol06G0175000 [Rhododendron molle]